MSGLPLIAISLHVKSSFTFEHALVLSYNKTTNRDSCNVSAGGSLPMAGVTESNRFHVSHAVLFPFHANAAI